LRRGTRNRITELPNFRRGRHLYSAGRPSRWASAHILVVDTILVNSPLSSPPLMRQRRLMAHVFIYAKTFHMKLECGPMPNVMAALPNIGGALFSTPQTLADANYSSAVQYAAKTRTPLKFAGVPQTRQQISAASGPTFTILWGHVGETSLFHNFSDCRYVP